MKYENLPNLSSKNIIVTGANSGLGFEITRKLANNNATVIMACRDGERAEKAKSLILKESPDAKLHIILIDLASLESVRNFANDVTQKYESIDILINNAGVMMLPYAKTKDGFEMHIGVNYLGHFALTNLLLPLLTRTKNSRIVTMSGIINWIAKINWEDINFQDSKYYKMRAYAQSKLACLLFALELNDKLKNKGHSTISVAAHPGYSNTDLSKHSFFLKISGLLFAQSSDKGSLVPLYAATSSDIEGGSHYGPNGFLQMRGVPHQIDLQKEFNKKWFTKNNQLKLWELSKTLTGIDSL